MSFINNAKEFFGLGPVDVDQDDPYFADERRYESNSAGERSAYAPRSESYDRAPREEFAPTIVPISLTSYTEAAGIGDPFRDGDAVVFELTDADKANAKRLIDFAAGLCFGLRGQMKNLTKKMDTERVVFAIIPENAKLSTIELERAAGLR